MRRSERIACTETNPWHNEGSFELGVKRTEVEQEGNYTFGMYIRHVQRNAPPYKTTPAVFCVAPRASNYVTLSLDAYLHLSNWVNVIATVTAARPRLSDLLLNWLVNKLVETM